MFLASPLKFPAQNQPSDFLMAWPQSIDERRRLWIIASVALIDLSGPYLVNFLKSHVITASQFAYMGTLLLTVQRFWILYCIIIIHVYADRHRSRHNHR